MEAAMAATRAASEMWPKERCHFRLRTASSTISSVAAQVRITSGKRRINSAELGTRLAGMGELSRNRRVTVAARDPDLERHVYLGLLQHTGGSGADERQEALRVHSHPHHHRDEGNHYCPLAPVQIRDVRPHLVRRLAEKDSLDHPEHITR